MPTLSTLCPLTPTRKMFLCHVSPSGLTTNTLTPTPHHRANHQTTNHTTTNRPSPPSLSPPSRPLPLLDHSHTNDHNTQQRNVSTAACTMPARLLSPSPLLFMTVNAEITASGCTRLPYAPRRGRSAREDPTCASASQPLDKRSYPVLQDVHNATLADGQNPTVSGLATLPALTQRQPHTVFQDSGEPEKGPVTCRKFVFTLRTPTSRMIPLISSRASASPPRRSLAP